MSQLPNVDPSEPKRPSQPPDKCAQCGAPEASSIHATESKNAEIRMASHRFAAQPADVEAARASELLEKANNHWPGSGPITTTARQIANFAAAYASQQCAALRRELADVKGERDRQYEENVNRIVMQAAAEREARNLREALAAIASVPDDAPNAPATLRSIIVRAKCALRVAEERKKPPATAEGPNPIGQSDQ